MEDNVCSTLNDSLDYKDVGNAHFGWNSTEDVVSVYVKYMTDLENNIGIRIAVLLDEKNVNSGSKRVQ